MHHVDALASGPGGAAVARVVLTLELSPVGDGLPARESGLGIEQLGGGRELKDAVAGALRRALDDAARGLALHLAAAAKADGALVSDLSAADPAVRDHAVRVLAERKNPAALPGLVARLADPDPDVADRAVGALAELGDPRAVAPLVELAHRRGGRAVEQYARLVGDIGGDEARAWLETLAAGHPDADVRDAAEESLAAMARREAARAGAAATR